MNNPGWVAHRGFIGFGKGAQHLSVSRWLTTTPLRGRNDDDDDKSSSHTQSITSCRAGSMVGDYHDFCNDFAAGRLACIEPGVFALVARDKRICTRSIWLGAVADVLILGHQLVGVGGHHLA